MLLIHAFMTPSIVLATANRHVRALLTRLGKVLSRGITVTRSTLIDCDSVDKDLDEQEEDADQDKRLSDSSGDVRKDLASMTSLTLTMISFGTLAPMLLVFAPVVTWSNLRAMQWVGIHGLKQHTFGEQLAERILVPLPITLFQHLSFGLNLVISAFVFFDLVSSDS